MAKEATSPFNTGARWCEHSRGLLPRGRGPDVFFTYQDFLVRSARGFGNTSTSPAACTICDGKAPVAVGGQSLRLRVLGCAES